MIYIGATVAAIALVLSVLLITSISFRHSLGNLPLVFLDGQKIEIVGEFVCVPTTGIDICIKGFRNAEGRHYLLTNMEEITWANPGLSSLSQTGTENKFHVAGVFSHGAPDDYSYVLVAGQIKVTSLTLAGNDTGFIVPK